MKFSFSISSDLGSDDQDEYGTRPEPARSPGFGFLEPLGKVFVKIADLCPGCRKSLETAEVSQAAAVFNFNDWALETSSRPTDTAEPGSSLVLMTSPAGRYGSLPAPVSSPACGTPKVEGWDYVSILDLCPSCRAAAQSERKGNSKRKPSLEHSYENARKRARTESQTKQNTERMLEMDWEAVEE